MPITCQKSLAGPSTGAEFPLPSSHLWCWLCPWSQLDSGYSECATGLGELWKDPLLIVQEGKNRRCKEKIPSSHHMSFGAVLFGFASYFHNLQVIWPWASYSCFLWNGNENSYHTGCLWWLLNYTKHASDWHIVCTLKAMFVLLRGLQCNGGGSCFSSIYLLYYLFIPLNFDSYSVWFSFYYFFLFFIRTLLYLVRFVIQKQRFPSFLQAKWPTCV